MRSTQPEIFSAASGSRNLNTQILAYFITWLPVHSLHQMKPLTAKECMQKQSHCTDTCNTITHYQLITDQTYWCADQYPFFPFPWWFIEGQQREQHYPENFPHLATIQCSAVTSLLPYELASIVFVALC